jgi:hypothetical protein
MRAQVYVWTCDVILDVLCQGLLCTYMIWNVCTVDYLFFVYKGHHIASEHLKWRLNMQKSRQVSVFLE